MKIEVSPQEHVDWLKTCGHANKPTVVLIDKMKSMIDDMVIDYALPGYLTDERRAEIADFIHDYGDNSDDMEAKITDYVKHTGIEF